MYFRKTNEALQLKIIKYAISILETVHHERLVCISVDVWRRICRNSRGDVPYRDYQSVVDLLEDYGAMKRLSADRFVFEKNLHPYIALLKLLLDDENSIAISCHSLEIARKFGYTMRDGRKQILCKSAFNDHCLRFKKSYKVSSYIFDSALNDLYVSGSLKSISTSGESAIRVRSWQTRFYGETFRYYFSRDQIKRFARITLLELKQEQGRLGLFPVLVETQKILPRLALSRASKSISNPLDIQSPDYEENLSKWEVYLVSQGSI